MRLYHFTDQVHLPEIMRSQVLETTESNIGSPDPDWKPFGSHLGPDVVWLLDTPAIDAAHGLIRHPSHVASLLAVGYSEEETDKTRIRFEVSIPKHHVHKWTKWHPARSRMNPTWRSALIQSAGGDEAASHWWVSTSPIPAKQWVEVRDVGTDQVLWTPDNGYTPTVHLLDEAQEVRG